MDLTIIELISSKIINYPQNPVCIIPFIFSGIFTLGFYYWIIWVEYGDIVDTDPIGYAFMYLIEHLFDILLSIGVIYAFYVFILIFGIWTVPAQFGIIYLIAFCTNLTPVSNEKISNDSQFNWVYPKCIAYLYVGLGLTLKGISNFHEINISNLAIVNKTLVTGKLINETVANTLIKIYNSNNATMYVSIIFLFIMELVKKIQMIKLVIHKDYWKFPSLLIGVYLFIIILGICQISSQFLGLFDPASSVLIPLGFECIFHASDILIKHDSKKEIQK
ncbi:hypothetical protein HNP89_001464 [Methanococcus maripaludis]|uniref:Uncharacterized protein n=1 Tax=Methanococcus maripaludis TaxID=39152 RepID=A0A7J9P0L5_METMI|nr:hypothetical protein [Methanococcus maripaludis]MBA2853488.1 hypothetical protein [Methanococcus maripaludis]